MPFTKKVEAYDNQRPFDDMFFVSGGFRKVGFKSVGENVQMAKSLKLLA